MTIPQAFALAHAHHRAGRLAEAEAIYRQILAVQPGHAEALNSLGVLAHQAGRDELAVELIGRAIAAVPGDPTFHYNLGIVLAAQERVGAAISAYRRAIAMRPEYAEAHINLGDALKRSGQLEEAVAVCRRAVQLRPHHANACNSLANALNDLGHVEEAIAYYRRALELQPAMAMAHNNLGIALRRASRWEEAVAACARAVELDPALAEARHNLGNALLSMGRADEAIAAYRQAIELRPDFAEVHNNLGNAFTAACSPEEAIASYQRAIMCRPHYAEAHNNLGDALKNAGRLDEAIACYRRAVAHAPDCAAIHSNLIYTLHYHPSLDATVLAEENARWSRQFAEPMRKHRRPHANSREPERRLRIGYVSPDFSRHVISHFLAPVLEAHDHGRFEIHCYASVRRPDWITERLRRAADVWKDVLALRDDALAETIRADGIDILVDLTQHTANNRLPAFACKPAPVQVAWLGYPGSTGLPTIDYRLTDRWMEPEAAPCAESVEKAVWLPDSWFCFDPLTEFPGPGELPALRTGHVTFGSLNNFCKVNDAVLDRWAGVLRAVPGSRLRLRCPAGEPQQRVRALFRARGVAAERIDCVGWLASREKFLGVFEEVDIALDPFPYNGATTTCEALWMGVPVLTVPGSQFVSRIGLSILSAAGMREFVAESEARHLELATSLAQDLPRLAGLRATLRERMRGSPFMDARRFTHHMESAYRTMWRSWCGAA